MAVQRSQATEASRKLSAAAGITEKVFWTTQPLKETDLPEAIKSPSSRFVGLFLSSVFFSIDLCICFCANTKLFDYCNFAVLFEV